jgi:hypothetical protein
MFDFICIYLKSTDDKLNQQMQRKRLDSTYSREPDSDAIFAAAYNSIKQKKTKRQKKPILKNKRTTTKIAKFYTFDHLKRRFIYSTKLI